METGGDPGSQPQNKPGFSFLSPDHFLRVPVIFVAFLVKRLSSVTPRTCFGL